MHLFYTPDISGTRYTLQEDESKHCVRVLRLKIGEEIHLVDGKGGYYKAKILFDNPKACQLEVFETEHDFAKRPYYFHLAIAPTKNTDRIEWLLEKAVEIGIDEFTPLICDHSERRHISVDRLERIAISAMKQSLKAYLPKINEAISFKKIIEQNYEGQKFIAHCINESEPVFRKESLQKVYKEENRAICLIGPEGDFSPEEVKLAVEKGFQGVSLGTSRLRTETAGLVACHTVYLKNEN